MAITTLPTPLPVPAESRAVVEIDGVRIFVICSPIVSARSLRFEIRLQGAGMTAIVDVPGDEESALDGRIREAVAAFSRTLGHRARRGIA